MFIKVTESEIRKVEKEFMFFNMGTSGSFTTHLFSAFLKSDTNNFMRLAESFPAHAFCVVREHNHERLKHFEVETAHGTKRFTSEESD